MFELLGRCLWILAGVFTGMFLNKIFLHDEFSIESLIRVGLCFILIMLFTKLTKMKKADAEKNKSID